MLRILVPFAAGILLHDYCNSWYPPVILLAIAVVAYAMLALLGTSPIKRYKFRPFFFIPIAAAGLSLGWIAALIHCPPRIPAEQRSHVQLTGRVQELAFTDFSMRMTVDLMDAKLPRCKVEVSTRGCDYTMRAGDVITWNGQLHEVGNLGNPFEMDYAAYLLHEKGIRYQQHLPHSQIHRIGHSSTLTTRMADVRRGLTLKVMNSRLSPAAQKLVVALLLGDNDMIDKTTRMEFSGAGIAHVLALSGLHMGIIAMLIWWLLFPLDYLRLKKLRLMITLMAIGCFAVFTGQSPSVVRSALMMGLTCCSVIFYRRSNPINSLCVAALLILVFSPASIYSVGFQLSFTTVAAILLFFSQQSLPLNMGNNALNRLIAISFTTLIATLATLSLTAHYFHTVSFLSLVTNVLVLPVLPVFMVLGALFLLLMAAGLHCALLDHALDAMSRYVHWSASTVFNIPWSHAGSVYVSTTGAIAYMVFIALLAMWLCRRDHRYYLWAAGGVCIFMLAHSLWLDSRMSRHGLVVFNSFSSTPVLYYDNGIGYFWVPDDPQCDVEVLNRFFAGFLSAHHIDETQVIDNDSTIRMSGVLISPPFAHLMNHRILAAGRSRWEKMGTASSSKMLINDIILTKRFKGPLTRLRERFDFDRVIISGAMQPSVLFATLHECDSLGVTAHALHNDGACEFQ